MTAKYVVLGWGSARSKWVTKLATWSTAGAIPLEFSKCISAAEVIQRLGGLRGYSAVIVDQHDEALTRAARDAAVPVFFISERQPTHSVFAASFPESVEPGDLLAALASHCSIVTNAAAIELAPFEDVEGPVGALTALCGHGGAGTSTLAMALAQQAASDVLNTGLVALADFTQNAELGMLHDALDVMPSVEELVEASRSRRPTSQEVRALTHAVERHGYDLVLGVRRKSAWTAMTPTALSAALEGLRRTYSLTIADVTPSFDGEAESGSRDIEERNAASRVAVLNSDRVLVVGNPSMKGVHATGRILRELVQLGIAPESIQPVMNRTPKRFLSEREIRKALMSVAPDGVNRAIFVREHNVEGALRDGAALPKTLAKSLHQQTTPSAIHLRDHNYAGERIAPGSLATVDEAVGQ